MKKTTILLVILASLLLFTPSSNASAANSITNRLKGRLLLQVEKGGAIWYVNPNDSQKYQVTWANALSLFQRFALGITNADLIKIPADTDSIDSNLDSDSDGYSDKTELQNGYSPYIPGSNKGRFKTDNNLANRLKGRLLLQVQQGGAIWYVDVNGKRHNVRWGNLMSLFRKLALGITDKDLEGVGNVDTSNWRTYRNEKYGFEFKYPSNWQFQFADVAPHFTSPDKKAELFIDENPTQGRVDFIKSDGEFIKEMQVGIMVAKLYNYADIIGTTSYLLFENKNFVIQFVPHYDSEQYNIIFQKILSTFKFIENIGEFTSPGNRDTLVIGKREVIIWQMPNGDTYYSLTIDLINEQGENLGSIINWNWVKYNPVNSASWDVGTVYNQVPTGTTPEGQTVYELKPDKNIKIEPGNYKLRLNYEYSDDGVKGSFDSNYFKIIN